MTTATAATYTGTFPGRAEEARRVRHEVARHLAGCPAAGDTVLAASDSRPTPSCTAAHAENNSPSASTCTPTTSQSNARTPADHGGRGDMIATGPTG